MASSHSDSEDEIVHAVRKRSSRRNCVNSDSSEGSDVETRPRRRGAMQQIPLSPPSSDESNNNMSRPTPTRMPSGDQQADVHPSMNSNSSDGEQVDKCAICLSKFQDQEIANPECCDHMFCSDCLLKWAKKMNTCPIDRLRFQLVLVRNPNGEILRTMTVSEKALMGDDSDSSEAGNCIVCGDNSERGEMLMCDQCNLVYHRDCIILPNVLIFTEGAWLCPICTFVGGPDNSVRQLVTRSFRPPGVSSTSHDLRRSAAVSEQESDDGDTDSTSSESSDENSQINNNIRRRLLAQEIRIRRQCRNSSSRIGNPSVLLSQSILERADGLATDRDDDSYEYGFANINVLSRVRRQTFQRVKSTLLLRQTPAPSLRPNTTASTSTDLLGGILHLQNLIHSPGSTLRRDGIIAHNSSSVGLQCPLNPSQNSPSKCGNNDTSQPNSTFSSSSSSSGSGSSQCRDLYSVPGCSMMASNSNADGYDTDSCSMVTHRSYGSSSVPEELKREDRESTHLKENSKSHSDEDVDIYSDIESTNGEDELSLDAELQAVNISYKPDEARLPPVTSTVANPADGSDSSDNDLVIDEDLPAEEDSHKNKYMPQKTMDMSSINNNNNVITDVNEYSNSSNPEEEGSSENSKVAECIQSPDDNANRMHNNNSNCQEYNDSSDSFKKSVEGGRSDETKQGFYADSEIDSQDVNSLGNEADEENSTHSVKAAVSNEQSQEYNPCKFSNSDGDLKLHFNLKAITSEISNDNINYSSPYSPEKVTDMLDSSSSIGGIDTGENVSENDLRSNENCRYDFQKEECNMNQNQGDLHEADSNCSVAKDDNFVGDKNDSQSPQYAHSDGSQVEEDNDDKSCNNDVKEDYTSPNNMQEENENPVQVPVPMHSEEGYNKKPYSYDQENSLSPEENAVVDSLLENCKSDGNENNGSFVEMPVGYNYANTNKKNEIEKDQGLSPSMENDDLGIEDISDAASDELNQPDSSMDCDQFNAEQTVADEVERNVAQLFEEDSSLGHKQQMRDEKAVGNSEDLKRPSSSSRQSMLDDHEEGEIIDELPYRKKDSRRDYYMHEDDDFMDAARRVNVSDLPRIPKIKRNSTKPSEVQEIPVEAKRTSVLGRIDLGSADISWKRLSQHTRERSYRDGRPKDESLLFRDREPRQKKSKSNFSERKTEEKHKDSDRSKKDDQRKQETGKSREKFSRDRKSDRNKSEYEKPSRQSEKSYSSSEKRDKDKHGKLHDRSNKDKYDRDSSKNERESKKDKRDKHKDKSSRDHDKYQREKNRSEDKYRREIEQYDISEDEYERSYEKSREKEYKHKHRRESRDHKSEINNKKNKEEKRKRSHSSDLYSDKLKEREVRKIDDKLKIVVEHKEAKKDKGDKHSEKKHSKKHSSHHHHEKKKKEIITSPFSDNTPTPIESKEIFAKGDSIIINVNFNRSSPREVLPASTDDIFTKDKKPLLLDLPKMENVISADENSKPKHALRDKDNLFIEAVTIKGPSTPDGRLEKSSTMPVGEVYWRETDDVDVCSPEKRSVDKNSSEKDDATPTENFGADDNITDSDDDAVLPEVVTKNDEFKDIKVSDKQVPESAYTENKESESFNSTRCRSPQPRSPPSPADNDSYDPCEPTRSPSPPPSPPSPAPPPLPSKTSSDHPKPPPSPELPPLPPGPEPTDIIPRDELRIVKSGASAQNNEIPSNMNSIITQHPTTFTQTVSSDSGPPAPNVLMPPPSFPPRSAPSVHSQQVMPPRTVGWQVTNPPPAPIIFQPNHVQPIIRGNFLPSHIPTMNMPPPNVSATLLTPTNSVSPLSQVRHLQLTTHGMMPNNSLIANMQMNLPQMQIQHLPHPVANAIASQHSMTSLPNHTNNLSQQGSAVVRLLSMQNQLPNIAVTIQNQHLANVLQSQNLNQFLTSQNQMPVPTSAAAFKPDKLLRNSPSKEKNEVVDMDVDSPYSPGDSPSMDSNGDYSPAASPIQKSSPGAPQSKDPFDNLLGLEWTNLQDSAKAQNKSSGKHRQSSNCPDTPNKKAKSDSKDSSSKSKHSTRLHHSEKSKSRKEQKMDKKDMFSKMDDTQLKILDELPSSAVEMQVKEKFLKKLNRQERVVEEVKLVLKPYYKTREVNKEEYKDILRKCVPKICHNKSGEINPLKVKHLVESYVKKVKHSRKKAAKRHKSNKFS